MILVELKLSYFLLYLLLLLNKPIIAEYDLEEKYFVQLYPSMVDSSTFYFNIPNKGFVTINCAIDDCQEVKRETKTEFAINGLSSVILIDNNYLVKTCIGPDKIVEIINKKNETYFHENNNLKDESGNKLNNIKFCYSTSIIYKGENVILSYWTEFQIQSGKEVYTHKCIIFNPTNNHFLSEITLEQNSNSINNNFYPENCITFRKQDIYCTIPYKFTGTSSNWNSFNIDTSKIENSKGQINLIRSNIKNENNIYQKPINIYKGIHDSSGGYYDVFLTEYMNERNENNKGTRLITSLFRKSASLSIIQLSEFLYRYYGINIEGQYINPNLFNHIIPTQYDLLVIYIQKNNDQVNLIMSRYDLSASTFSLSYFIQYSLSNYLRDDICREPKHIQSIFVNSLIKYTDSDQSIIINNGIENYYQFQRDIVTLIACDNNGAVDYEQKKIVMPQCLNILDEINGKDFHKFLYQPGEDKIELDIMNDPNLVSLRNVTIQFPPLYLSSLGNKIIIRVIDDKDTAIVQNSKYNFTNVSKIQIFKTFTFTSKNPIYIYYKIIQTIKDGSSIKCHLQSDLCNLQLKVETDCSIDFCVLCNGTKCGECEGIEGVKLDNGKCVCDEGSGFKKNPKKFTSPQEISMCICKDNYSFYKNITLCLPNSILKNGSYYVKEIDDISLIDIYDDNIPGKDDGGDICLYNNNIWFKLGEHEFKYARIKECVYIFYKNDLFFYSNKADCSSIWNNVDSQYISYCLQKILPSKREYEDFLKEAKEYNRNDYDITIKKEIDNLNFHLINGQINSNYSEINLNEKCIEKLSEIYQINNDSFLVFKVDIKRNDTISRQVEYQLYNPEPRKIYVKLNISKCLREENKERLLEAINGINTTNETGSELEIDEVLITIPVDWNETHLKYIEELYNQHHINFYDPTDPFYNDVCYSYRTPNNSDIYIQERREKYYPRDPLCQDNCTAIDFDNTTNKIVCKCPIR